MSSFIAKNKASLRFLLIVSFVLQVILAVGLTGYLSWRNKQQATDDLASQLQKEVSARIDQHLDSYLGVPHQINQVNEYAIRIGALQLNNFEKLGQYFWKQMTVFPIGYINYGDPQGRFIGVERLDDGKLQVIEDTYESVTKDNIYQTDSYGRRTRLVDTIVWEADGDHRQEDWYKDALAKGRPLWSSIYQWSDDPEVLSISLSYPVYGSNQKFIGVIGVDLILSQISQNLRQIKPTSGSQIFIIERDGLLVASSSSEKPYIVSKKEAQRLNVFNSKEPVIRATAENLRDVFGDFNALKNPQQLNFQFNNQRQFVQVAPWQDKYGLNWLVVVVTPQSDFMGQIDANNRTTIWLCLVALALAIILGIYTSRWISKPILRLSEASEAIANGQLDRQVKVEGVSEVKTLARAFNQMAQQLRESFAELKQTNAELETRVEERTAQFKKAVQAAMKAASQSATAQQAAEEAKEAAETANRTKGEFLANMSHELRTPLNSILGYASILMHDRNLSEQQLKGAKIIQRSGNHLLTLINDILEFSQAEVNKLTLEPSDFHFPIFLEEVCGIIEMRSQEKNLLFRYETAGELPTGVRADEKRLRQVLINLLGNAVKFTDRGQVTLKVSTVGEMESLDSLPHRRIRFQVSDTGIGINSVYLEKIFQPFEQASDRTHRRGGTGLGLAISKQLVELMGSKLYVESKLGQSSTFWFDVSFPVVEMIPDSPQKLTEQVKSYLGRRLRILVVDDKQDNRSLLISMLKPLGFEIVMAKDGEQGLHLARQLKPDLILTDILMSVKTGLSMTIKIRQTPEIENVPIIAVSASTIEIMQETSLKAGCNAFLPKPVDKEKLLLLLEKYLKLEWVYQ
jgi:signal transduction histidine kinase/ActR/RegA family two-component response regulator